MTPWARIRLLLSVGLGLGRRLYFMKVSVLELRVSCIGAVISELQGVTGSLDYGFAQRLRLLLSTEP